MKSQIISPSAHVLRVPIDGDEFTAIDFNQFSPFEFVLGYYWQLPQKERVSIIRDFAEDTYSGKYTPVLNGVEQVLENHVDNFMSDLEEKIIKKTAQGTKYKANNLLRFKGDVINSPQGDLFDDPDLIKAGQKKYLDRIHATVKSIPHAKISGSKRTIEFDRHSIDRLRFGETEFSSDDFLYGLGKIKSQNRNRDRNTKNHFVSRYAAAAFSRYGEAKGLGVEYLPFNPRVTKHLMGEIITLYYLGKPTMPKAKKYAIDTQLLFLKDFVNDSLIKKMENHELRRTVQRNRLVKAEEFGWEDRMLKSAYVDYMMATDHIKWFDYVSTNINVHAKDFPLGGDIAELWLTPEQEYTLVFGKHIPPLVIRTIPDEKDVFDFYADRKDLPKMIDKRTFKYHANRKHEDPYVWYEGPLYDMSTGRYSYVKMGPPKLDNLPISSNIKNRIQRGIDYRTNKFLK